MRNSVILILLICSFSTARAAEPQKLLIDFGAPGLQASGNWNNLTNSSRIGLLLRNSIDSRGTITSVRVRQLDGWSGYNIDGHDGNKPYPSRALRDSFYLAGADDRLAKLRIEGLNPGEKYDFVFYGSRFGGENSKTSLYKIGRHKTRLDARNNRENTAVIENVTADQSGNISIEIECPAGQTFAYLGALEIRGQFLSADETTLPRDGLVGPPVVAAKAWVIADGRTGKPLWGWNVNEARQIASTTKIMTAWIILELASKDPQVFDEVVTISEQADLTTGTSADLMVGERAKVRDLLYGLLLPSGNDIAVALAEHFGERLRDPKAPPSGVPLDPFAEFTAAMNRRAIRTGLNRTTFLDPHGNSKNMSTTRDVLRLTWMAMQNPLFRKYVKTRVHRCEIIKPDGTKRRVTWISTNRMLGIDGFDGVKTGTTAGAGACLVASGWRGKDNLIVVVLGSTQGDGRYVDTRNLFRWAWKMRGSTDDKPAAVGVSK